MLGKLLVFACWLGLLGYTYQEASRVDIDLFGSGQPIANLAASAGQVQVRPIEFEMWNFVDAGQNLFEGNVLATGESSEARVSFDNGRDLVIGPNTQIVLSQESEDRGGQLVVTLLKGSVATEKAKEAVIPSAQKTLRLRSGSSDFVMKREDTQVSLNKSVASDRAQITVKTGQVEVTSQSQSNGSANEVGSRVLKASKEVIEVQVEEQKGDMALIKPAATIKSFALAAKTIPQEQVAAPLPARLPDIIPNPVVVPPPPANVAVVAEPIRVLPPQIEWPAAGVYWHVDSIARGKAGAFPIRLISTRVQSNFLKLSGEKASKWIRTPSAVTATARIAVSDIANLSSQNDGGWTLKMQAGVAPKENSLKGVKTSRAATYTFRSLADYGSAPVRANLLTLKRGAVGQDWFASEGELSDAAANFSVVLNRGRDLVLLAPQIANSEKFSVFPATLPSSGVYIAQRSGVVAWVAGKVLRQADLVNLRKTLAGEFSFKGRAAALLAVKDREALVTILKQASGDIYVLQKNKLTRVNRNLLVEKPIAAQFIIDNGDAFFAEEVEIVDVK